MMTPIIVIITSLVSVLAFNEGRFFNALLLNPYRVYHHREYHRLVSHALVHADWIHLLVNMFVLYGFGMHVEKYFQWFAHEGLLKHPSWYFLFFYLSATVVASFSTLKKFKDIPSYNSVGASGAVSAIVFSSIFFDPWQKLYFYGLLPVPGIVFGSLYLVYSWYMGKRGNDFINHDAHYWGAIYGIIFPLCIDYRLIYLFLERLMYWK